MADAEQLTKLQEGVEAWNAWRQAHADLAIDLGGVNLSKANLSKANLSGVTFNGAVLYGADLRWTNLQGAYLRGADLRWANLAEADLSRTDFSGAILKQANLNAADLSEAILREADLIQADLSEADLIQADFIGASLNGASFNAAELSRANLSRTTLAGTIFADVDLGQVMGLETIQHQGPSTLGIDTLVRSQGKIPEAFLRGCGVPDSWIGYLPSLIGALQPIQYFSCFISYASEDEAFAKRLHGRMQQEHLRVWFAPEKLKGGQKLRDQIDQAIHVYDKLLLVVSDASMISNWVSHEIRRAHQKGHAQKRRVLFPIRLTPFETVKQWSLPDDDTGLDLAAEIRRYYIPDFSNWKDHDAFEEAYARLLRDLKAAA